MKTENKEQPIASLNDVYKLFLDHSKSYSENIYDESCDTCHYKNNEECDFTGGELPAENTCKEYTPKI